LKRETADRLASSREKIYSLHEEAERALLEFPRLLSEAEKHLSDATKLFKERAFYLFWDKLELSAEAIQKYNDSVEILHWTSEEYCRLSETLNEPVPKFPGSKSSKSPI